ncbi:hypothetical protein [Porphyromonas miyakawae]|uniref:hypothetical protein n=1 Tax=Porphyromonas miyakawae TaxID=3137470 RepID=UPI00398C81FE
MNSQARERLGYTSNILSAYMQGIISGIKKINLLLRQNNNSNNRNWIVNSMLAQAIIATP